MPERIERLRETLAELEAELENLDSLDDDSRAHLRGVAAEIQAVLERHGRSLPLEESETEVEEPAAPPSPPHNLQERLVDTMETFDAQYPTLSGVLQRLVNGLAQLGI